MRSARLSPSGLATILGLAPASPAATGAGGGGGGAGAAAGGGGAAFSHPAANPSPTANATSITSEAALDMGASIDNPPPGRNSSAAMPLAGPRARAIAERLALLGVREQDLDETFVH